MPGIQRLDQTSCSRAVSHRVARSIVRSMVSLGLAVAATYFGAATALAADWPQFLGPHRNGSSDEKGLIDAVPPGGPPVVWRRPVGAGFSGPVIAGGRVIVFHQAARKIVADCLDALTGKPIWSTPVADPYQDNYGSGNGPRATPAVDGDLVVVFGPRSTLAALELESGKIRWKRELEREFEIPEGFFGASSSPVFDGEHVIVAVGAPDGAGIVAFDRKHGKTVWKAAKDSAGYASPVIATTAGRRLIFSFARSGLYALDRKTGEEAFFIRWRARINASVNAATPLVSGDQVFVSSSYQTGAMLVNVTPGGHEVVWKGDDIMSCHYNTPVIHDGHLYGIDGRQEGGARLRCVRLNDGKVMWTEEGFGCASIILAERRLYIVDERGGLTIAPADPEKFSPKGNAPIVNRLCRAQPALANDKLYVRGEAEIVCVDLKPR